jgi:hypothetical protein
MGYDRPLDILRQTKGLTASQRAAIEHDNAARLLRLPGHERAKRA